MPEYLITIEVQVITASDAAQAASLAWDDIVLLQQSSALGVMVSVTSSNEEPRFFYLRAATAPEEIDPPT